MKSYPVTCLALALFTTLNVERQRLLPAKNERGRSHARRGMKEYLNPLLVQLFLQGFLLLLQLLAELLHF